MSLYKTPVVAGGSGVVVTNTNGSGATPTVKLPMAVLLKESTTCTVKVNGPEDEDVPVSRPDELRLSQDGNGKVFDKDHS